MRRLLHSALGTAAVLAGIAATAPAAQALDFGPAPGSPFATPAPVDDAIIADFDGDGHVDVATIDSFIPAGKSGTAGVFVLLGDGDGGLTPVGWSPVDAAPGSVTAGDVDGDGTPDLVTFAPGYWRDSSLTVTLGNGDGTFTRAFATRLPVTAGGPTIADVTGSPAPDLVLTDSAGGELDVLVGAGDGTFAAGPSIAVGDSPGAPVVADLDGDGHVDLASATETGLSGGISVLLGDGSGSFAPAPGSPYSSGGAQPGTLLGVDLDADGDRDLAVNNVWSASLNVLLNDGSAGFAPAPALPPVGEFPLSPRAADFDGDGKLDLATVENVRHNVRVLLGDGAGGFALAPGSPFGAGHGGVGLQVADFDEDGRPDLLVVNRRSEVTLLLNGVVAPPQEPPVEEPVVEEPPVEEPVVEEPPADPPTLPGTFVPVAPPQPGEVAPAPAPPAPGTAAPAPAPAAAAAPGGLTLRTSSLRSRRGVTRVALTCARTGGDARACSGTLALRRTGAAAATKGSGTLASARFSIRAGATAKVALKLSAAGRRALAARDGRTLRVGIVVKATDAAGAPQALRTRASLR